MKSTDLQIGRSTDDGGACEEAEHRWTRPSRRAWQRALAHQPAGRIFALRRPDQDTTGDHGQITVLV
jgi:hypothetical protein